MYDIDLMIELTNLTVEMKEVQAEYDALLDDTTRSVDVILASGRPQFLVRELNRLCCEIDHVTRLMKGELVERSGHNTADYQTHTRDELLGRL